MIWNVNLSKFIWKSIKKSRFMEKTLHFLGFFKSIDVCSQIFFIPNLIALVWKCLPCWERSIQREWKLTFLKFSVSILELALIEGYFELRGKIQNGFLNFSLFFEHFKLEKKPKWLFNRSPLATSNLSLNFQNFLHNNACRHLDIIQKPCLNEWLWLKTTRGKCNVPIWLTHFS